MGMKVTNKYSGYSFVLLAGIGVSNIGDWIYLIAFNLIILDMTGSPLAVAVLYLLKPLAALFTNIWAGSLIDRLNKRSLMVWLDIIRAILVGMLPLCTSLSVIYSVVLLINMASAVFQPTSLSYITKLIPSADRNTFNSLRSLVDSGAFLIGPAVAGLLFMVSSPTTAVYLNGLSFLCSALLTILMPNLESGWRIKAGEKLLAFSVVRTDWKIVKEFSRHHHYVVLIYFLFSCVIVMTAAIDSLEAAFAKDVLRLTNQSYGLLVSIAGGGTIVGSVINTLISRRSNPFILMGSGSLFLSIGYLCFAFSDSFLIAALGFFVLSFSLAFANTGFYTFIQNNIPVQVMGRFSSIYGLVEAVLVILLTAAFGLLAHLVSIQLIVIAGASLLFILTIILCYQCQRSSVASQSSVG
ncbi:MFS transporter [Sediminibacillus albus]|uniref:Major Facilitator Superfamily protein n=1 Tax=Sediminibacillus albus TaxID=407036 RepID=A0A1G8VIQ3_9BACI|nr:MFS transporter [Sediminibacillus albus]SDJ65839.1 Major Facilitator Superfamily protein [Sediminibacillus albus]